MGKRYAVDAIGYALVIFWFLLIAFGFVSVANPPWLAKISSQGKAVEAKTKKDYGDLYMREGKYNLAVAQYESALEIKADFIDALVNLAIAFGKMGMSDKAIETMENALSKDPPKSHVIHYNLAEIYLTLGDLGSAVEHYAMAAKAAPFPLFSYYKIGKIYLDVGDWDSAIRAFRMALDSKLDMKNSYIGMLKDNIDSYRDDPGIKEAITSLLASGAWQEDLDKYDDEVFHETLRHDRGLSEIHYFIGYAFEMKKDFSKAIEHYRIALDIWPDNVSAQKNLNAALLRKI